MLVKGAIEFAPLPSPGFYSRLFVVMKASGAWRPVIDLSTLNLRVQQTSFKMETLQSVLLSVRPGDWMVSLDLKDAYLQVPMHPESRKFLRFMAEEKVYQFKVLCFGLSTAPQVFTRVMAPVSAILHRMGVRFRRYPYDWLLQASSREQAPCSEDSASALQVSGDSRQLGEVSDDSNSTDGLSGGHSELNFFQGFSCPEESREASLNWRHILVLRQTANGILARALRSAGLNDPARARRSSSHEISPACSAETVGSCGSVTDSRVVSGDSSGSRLVARPLSFGARHLSGASVPSARIVIRRLGRGLGGSLG